ncbi:MAG: cysteine desulfurase [Pirellulaceae bacterium]|nr:MAG: cysteine desulfurase [Pirellulaceae bacterium]
MDATAYCLDVAAIRRDFPILEQRVHGRKTLVYLDNAASAQRPRQVIETIDQLYRRHYANVHRGIHWLSEQSTELYETAREAVRQFLNAPSSDEIIFTSGTTAAINLVARSWCEAFLKPGDEILLTLMEHHSNIVPWQQAAQRHQAKIRFLPIDNQGMLDPSCWDQYFSPRTRLVSFTAVSNVLGTRNPVGQLVEAARRVGAVVLIDAAQVAPHEPIDVQAWGADFVALSGHKMLGPTGVGVLWGRREWLEKMPPFLGGGSMIRKVTLEGFEPASLPYKFEAGTPPIAEVVGLKAAVEYLWQIGLAHITEHEHRLTELAHEVLSDVGDIIIYGPSVQHKAGIVSFNLDGVHAQDVSEVLDQEGIAIRAGHHCAMPLHERLGVPATARASFYLYNTYDDVYRLGEALRTAKKLLRPGRTRSSNA